MKIALGVTGSISAYKAYDLARDFVNSGHKVRVLLTKGALAFIKAETFLYLGCEAVYKPGDDFGDLAHKDNELEGTVLHVALAKWADKMTIAPLSANTLATFCQGAATDLLSSTFLAWRKDKPLLLFPAMNTEMLTHPFVEENLMKLKTLPYVFIGGTNAGKLACGDHGAGKLSDIVKIKALTLTWTFNQKPQKNVLITTGATVAPLDEVRFLTNASSGKTAIPFIEEFLSLGHSVTVLAGIYATKEIENYLEHPSFKLTRIKTTGDMHREVMKNFSQCDLYISCAAIGDFEFVPQEGKIKKSALTATLEVRKTPDILAEVLSQKKTHQKVIGFAAESELSQVVLEEKFKRKPVDLLIGTKVSNGLTKEEGQVTGFQTNQAHYRFMTDLNSIGDECFLTKKEMVQTALPLIWNQHAAIH